MDNSLKKALSTIDKSALTVELDALLKRFFIAGINSCNEKSISLDASELLDKIETQTVNLPSLRTKAFQKISRATSIIDADIKELEAFEETDGLTREERVRLELCKKIRKELTFTKKDWNNG